MNTYRVWKVVQANTQEEARHRALASRQGWSTEEEDEARTLSQVLEPEDMPFIGKRSVE